MTEEIKELNSPICIKETKFIIKFHIKKTPGQAGFTGKVYQ